MKRLLAVTLLCITTTGFAQGVVNFNNNVLSSPPDRLVRCADGPLVGTNFVAQLVYQNAAGQWVAHTTTARFRVPTTAQPGTWVGGNRTLTAAGGVGIPVMMQVVFWDSNYGATYDQARAAGGPWGASAIFQYVQSLSSPPAPTDTYMANFAGFMLLSGNCVPEPSIALLFLPALAALWLIRSKGTK